MFYNKEPLIYMPRRRGKGNGGTIPTYNYWMNRFNTAGNVAYRAAVYMDMYCRDMVNSSIASIARVNGDLIKAPEVSLDPTQKTTKLVFSAELNPTSTSGYVNSFNNKLKFCYFTSDYSTPPSEVNFRHCYYLVSFVQDGVAHFKVYDIRVTSLGSTILITFNREITTATISGYTGNTPIKCYYHARFKNASATDICADAIEDAVRNTIGVAGGLYLTEEAISQSDWRVTVDEVIILNV